MKKITLVLFTLLIGEICNAQQQIPLYNAEIPNSKISSNQEQHAANAVVDTLTSKVSIPTLSVFLPSKGQGKGSAVIIYPGGGYGVLLTKREGSDVARQFAKLGIAAFVVKYRLPDEKIMIDKSIGPLQDALQAIKIVRQRANEWGIDKNKIGIMGFSAGGHLASTAGTRFDSKVIPNVEATSLRPDFLILINPLISFMDSIGHMGSRNALLGNSPSLEKIRMFANDLNVNKLSPPTFLVHTTEDVVVPVESSLRFYNSLRKYGISAEMHIYAKGEHGFLTKPSFDEWFGRCINWMKEIDLPKKP